MPAAPLQVHIVGAGIGGLTAANYLRQAGHVVDMWESSSFSYEIGAAVQLTPNGNGLLRKLGIVLEDLAATEINVCSEFRLNGEQLYEKDLKQNYDFPWQSVHRVDLHTGLRNLALGNTTPGSPVTIHLKSRVVAVDPDAGSITLNDGQTVTGDLIIGADGSVARDIITERTNEITADWTSAFRFIVPKSVANQHKELRIFSEQPGHLQLWTEPGVQKRVIFLYPCRNNQEINVLTLHKMESTSDIKPGETLKERLLHIFRGSCPSVISLLNMADNSKLGVWNFTKMESLNTWINGKAALLGDAAHFSPPNLSQGSNSALEDAAALGALFPLGTEPCDVHSRLSLYMKARYDRGTKTKEYARQIQHDAQSRGLPDCFIKTFMAFLDEHVRHDAYAHAKALLEKQTK